MSYTNESALIDDVYDYIFGNEHNIGTDFISEFPNSYVDANKACIYLEGGELGDYIIKIERITK
jgi:hypothetical protein